jgi:predicted permease
MSFSTRLGSLAQDSSYAFRSLRRAPGFSLFTALVIGLGVGAATAVFSVIKPLMLAPLPFEEPDRLVWISRGDGPSLSSVTSRSGNLRDFRERATLFRGLTGFNAFSEQTAYTLTGSGEPDRLVGFQVAHDFLEVLGVQPLHGRGFTLEEGVLGGPAAVVLSHGYWRNRFEADPTMVGRAITLNGLPRTVVGVLPPTFDFSSIFTPGTAVEFLLPYPVSEETDRHGNEVFILGRMRSGVTPEAAQAELDAVLAALQEEDPDRWGLGARLEPLQAHLAGPFLPAFLLLIGAAGTLLLMVCVNVSNLLLARTPRRAREVAVHKAVGAPRGRMVRQLVLEVSGIAVVGASMGGGLAWLATDLVERTAAIRIPLLTYVEVDASVLLFGLTVALVAGLLASVVPALQVTEGGEASVLGETGRGGGQGRRARRFTEGLVVSEVALACVLLVFSGLLVRSFRTLLDVDMGFDPSNVVAWQLNPSRGFETFAERSAFFTSISDRVAQVPGVEEVGMIDALPLGRNRGWILRVAGTPDEQEYLRGFFPHIVGAGYVSTMRIPLVAGRDLTRDDLGGSTPVVLLNETAAERVFGDEEALGRRIVSQDIEWEVVGIVQDVRHVSPESGSGPQVYFPITQMWDFRTMDLVVRSNLPVDQIAGAVGAALREVDGSMPVRESWTLDFTVDRALSARRFTLGVLVAYGATALLLAALGIYGVLAQSVAERTHEIGIRVALGASEGKVVLGVLGRLLFLALAGILLGAAVSAGVGRFAESLLFGVTPTDPLTYLGMVLVLLLVAFLAGLGPARAAAHIRGTRALQVH